MATEMHDTMDYRLALLCKGSVQLTKHKMLQGLTYGERELLQSLLDRLTQNLTAPIIER